jgi:predicted dehydrogenase
MAAICDIDAKALSDAKAKFGVSQAYKGYRELLAKKDIDAVSVCLPNRLHSIVSVAAFEAGKHVLCEKPMAINAKEAQRMVDAAKKANRKLQIGLTFRFQNRVVVKGLSVTGTGETMGTVTVIKVDRARPIDGHDEVDSQTR